MTYPKGLETPQAMDWTKVVDMEFFIQSFNKQQFSTQLVEAIQELNIQPVLLERMVEAVEQTVNRALSNNQPARDPPVLRARIWYSLVQEKCGGWGFFLVEKLINAYSQPGDQATNIVDLFLYQERRS